MYQDDVDVRGRGKRGPSETLPLHDYRADGLQKLHAHSSAETSGLGDSLQRIHQHSSTETSGYGETVPSPTAHSPGETARYSPRGSGRTEISGRGARGRQEDYEEQYGYREGPPEDDMADQRQDDFESLYASSRNPSGNRDDRDVLRVHGQSPARGGAAYGDDDHYDGEHSAGESPSTSRRGSMSDPRSAGFMGLKATSTWLLWSQARRASFKRRLDNIERRQTDMEKNRVSTPIRKARKESVMFVSQELEDQHVMRDEFEEQQEKLHKQYNVESKKKSIKEESQRMTREMERVAMARWTAMVAFWEQTLFVVCRIFGTFVSLVAIGLGVGSLVNDHWYSIWVSPIEGTIYSGLFRECLIQNSSTECSSIETNYWQNAVIGLLIFSEAFGFLATVLSVCGIITTTLSKKIYYYHSAGEIYFICAVSTTAALMAFPIAINLEQKMEEHHYGAGYAIGWGSAVCFFIASICMCLDDLVRTIAKGLCCSCFKKDTEQDPYKT